MPAARHGMGGDGARTTPRRRPHPAEASRIGIAGLGLTVTLTMTAGLAATAPPTDVSPDASAGVEPIIVTSRQRSVVVLAVSREATAVAPTVVEPPPAPPPAPQPAPDSSSRASTRGSG